MKLRYLKYWLESSMQLTTETIPVVLFMRNKKKKIISVRFRKKTTTDIAIIHKSYKCTERTVKICRISSVVLEKSCRCGQFNDADLRHRFRFIFRHVKIPKRCSFTARCGKYIRHLVKYMYVSSKNKHVFVSSWKLRSYFYFLRN